MVRYLIIAFTSDIDLVTCKVGINFLGECDSNVFPIITWTNCQNMAKKFDTRKQAQDYIDDLELENCVTYRVDFSK